jgi:hypothetical protein
MAIKTKLNVAPYFNDFSPDKQYYELPFKPGTTYVRELNNLQSYLQNQIEMFGSNIFKSGTIVSGCSFSFYPNYTYIKVEDENYDGNAVEPSVLKGFRVRNAKGLSAYVTNYRDGAESNAPNLKTLYINYQNSGFKSTFERGEELYVDDGKASIFGVTIANGGLYFANTDSIVFVPQIEVTTTTGTFTNAEYIYDSVYGSNAQIINITNVGTNTYLLTLKPLTSDLANDQVNADAWTFGVTNQVNNSGDTVSAIVNWSYGVNAAASIITSNVGKVQSVVMTAYGDDYYYLPYVTIKSSTGEIGNTSFVARNYYDRITVSSTRNAVGNGYAFGVSDGVIYQAGHFLKVKKQIVVVNAYSSSPNNVCVGFNTNESIVTYLEDAGLKDNAVGEENYGEKGADRLKLTPTLVVENTGVAINNNEFCVLVYWNNGYPSRQQQTSVYSRIGDEMAGRMMDQTGNFVMDKFLVTTATVGNTALNGTHYSAVVDPGTAYISGRKVDITRNWSIDVPKATETQTTYNRNITLNYDAYVRVNEVGGLFQFSTGANVSFYNAAKDFLSNSSLILSGNTTPQGSLIGSARMRSMVLENGYSGDPTAIYRIHLFDIKMNQGRSFRDIRSLYYNGATYKGICDVVLEQDATTATSIAVLHGAKNDTLVFETGADSIRNTNNSTYVYRTIDQTTETANTGLLVKSVAGAPFEKFPYSPTLSDADLRDLYVVPIEANLVAYDYLTGTIDVDTSTTDCVGTATDFITDLRVGDYVQVGNTDTNDIKRVANVVNSTFVSLDSNCSFACSSANIWRAFPQYAPIPFGNRDGLSANLNANTNVLTLDFGMTFEGTTNTDTLLGVSVKVAGGRSTPKTAIRNRYVKLRLANNSAGATGPWCLGVPEAMRLRNVYIGISSVDTTYTDLRDEFYIDCNHTSNYADLSFLALKPKSSKSLSTDDYLLVCFDYFKRADDGYFDTTSYIGTSKPDRIAYQESLPLANLTNFASVWEVPEFYDSKDVYHDMKNCIDFRPAVVNTVAATIDDASAPINPPYTISFGNTADPNNDKKFPLPDSAFLTNIEQYKGRVDAVTIGKDGLPAVQRGTADVDSSNRYMPLVSAQQLLLNKVLVPPYPNISINLSNTVFDIIDTGVHSKGKVGIRLSQHQIKPVVANTLTSVPSQPQRYTKGAIGQLERRIRDLEYYVNLSLVEKRVAHKIIPSSITGTLDRFKFGFFVDDFSSWNRTDKTDPQFKAEIETQYNTVETKNAVPIEARNLATPPKFRWGVRHGVQLLCPFIEEQAIIQPYATDSQDFVHPGCIPTSTIETTFVTNTVTAYVTSNVVTNVTSNVVTTSSVVANSLAFAAWYGDWAASSSARGWYTTQRSFQSYNTSYGGNLKYTRSEIQNLKLTSELDMVMADVGGPVTIWFLFRTCPSIRVYQSHVPIDNPTIRLTPVGGWGGGLMGPLSGFAFTNVPGATPRYAGAIATLIYGLPSNTIVGSFEPAPTEGVYRKVADTSTAVALTSEDIAYFRSNTAALSFWSEPGRTGSNYRNLDYLKDRLTKYGGEWVGGAGKFEFNHDPTYGRYYYCDVSLAGGPGSSAVDAVLYHAMCRYPVVTQTTSTTQTVVTQVVNTISTPITTTVTETINNIIIDPCGETGTPEAYTGIMNVSYSLGGGAVPDYSTHFDTVNISVVGLIPNAKFTLYINGEEVDSNNVKPAFGNFGDDLYSSSSGYLLVEYYLPTTNWADRIAELGLTKTPSESSVILNEGNEVNPTFVSRDYLLFEVVAPNSRAGAKLHYVPWTSFT